MSNSKPVDFSGFYESLAAEYGWTPTYIRDGLTEVQLYGYSQHIWRRKKNLVKWIIAEFMVEFWNKIVTGIFGKKGG